MYTVRLSASVRKRARAEPGWEPGTAASFYRNAGTLESAFIRVRLRSQRRDENVSSHQNRMKQR